MIRGTTPTEVYTLLDYDALDLTSCVQIWVTFHDHAGHDYTWEINRLAIDAVAHTLTLTLTQEETLALAVGRCLVQIRFLYEDGTAFASKPMPFVVEDVRRDGVIE